MSIKESIRNDLNALSGSDFLECTKQLLSTLGYESKKTMRYSGKPSEFLADAHHTKARRNLLKSVKSLKLVFQLTDEEISGEYNFFHDNNFDINRAESFYFVTAELKPGKYGRTKYAEMAREINKHYERSPAVILFRVKNLLTIAFTDRRPHKRDKYRDVLGKVTLIKDICLDKPHRAHVDILSDLSLTECAVWIKDNCKKRNFDGLLSAWLAKLDTEVLNKQFYKRLFEWFEYALYECTFPKNENKVLPPEEHVIRLITRLMFVWFMKEKGLVSERLFNEQEIKKLLKNYDLNQDASYYRAILQNLFFATLNTEIEKRGFSKASNTVHHNPSSYCYKKEMVNTDELLKLFKKTPFINGGLFDCLDSVEGQVGKRHYIDCFSNDLKQYKKLRIPNHVFFGEKGLIRIFEHYKFTVEENTPIEQEVALDPELLGKVFENLLSAYNPETHKTARKQTGSYYTPRMMVDYMVDEALIACLIEKVAPSDNERKSWQEKLRYLLDYSDSFDDVSELFSKKEKESIVRAITKIKMLDPAVGSGAFPMSVLHKLTLALCRIDPENQLWEMLQKENARKRAGKAFDTYDAKERKEKLNEISNTFDIYRSSDFGRKLYLIQNNIFGVDIQPIACQIAKLRFFISLAIEQEPDMEKKDDNYGIKPLPNLETHFVSANTLLGLDEWKLISNDARDLKLQLRTNRERYFHARTPRSKQDCRDLDQKLRSHLAKELKQVRMPTGDVDKIAHWDPYDQNSTSDWFDAEYMLGITDGLDIVIGNPPYVRADSGSAHLASRQQIKRSNTYKTLSYKWDLFIPFMELGLKLLCEGGVTSLIISDAYCNAKYATKSRQWFLQDSCILRIDFYGEVKIFEAGVHNISYLIQRKDGTENMPLRRLHRETFGNVTNLESNIQRDLDEKSVFSPKGKFSFISDNHIMLKEIFYISCGLQACSSSDLNKKFNTSDLLSDVKDNKHPTAFLLGKDIGRYCHLRLRYLEWGTDRSPAKFRRQTFLELHNALEKIIVQRSSGKKEVKILYDKKQIHFDVSSVGLVRWDTLKGVKNKSITKSARYSSQRPCADEKTREELEEISRRFSLLYVCGIMASKSARKLLDSKRRSKTHLYPDDWKNLPIPDVPENLQLPIAELVQQVLTAKEVDPKADTKPLEDKIDKLVEKLYNS